MGKSFVLLTATCLALVGLCLGGGSSHNDGSVSSSPPPSSSAVSSSDDKPHYYCVIKDYVPVLVEGNGGTVAKACDEPDYYQYLIGDTWCCLKRGKKTKRAGDCEMVRDKNTGTLSPKQNSANNGYCFANNAEVKCTNPAKPTLVYLPQDMCCCK